MKSILQVAPSSASEVEYHLLLAEDLQFLTADEFNDVEGKVLEMERVLASLLRRPQSPILARC
jgi:four helix bundle protein